MTEKQKQAINIINRLHDVYGEPTDLCMTDDEYFLLLEMIMNCWTEQCVLPNTRMYHDITKDWLNYKPLKYQRMSKKEELAEEYANKNYYELMLKGDLQEAFEAGWDAAIENITKNSFITEFWWIKPIMYATSDLRLPDINNDDKVRVVTIKEE